MFVGLKNFTVGLMEELMDSLGYTEQNQLKYKKVIF